MSICENSWQLLIIIFAESLFIDVRQSSKCTSVFVNSLQHIQWVNVILLLLTLKEGLTEYFYFEQIHFILQETHRMLILVDNENVRGTHMKQGKIYLQSARIKL